LIDWSAFEFEPTDSLRASSAFSPNSLAFIVSRDKNGHHKLTLSFCGSYMDLEDLAKRIRDACLRAALEAYEDAGMQGLCAEGRWEAAVGALQSLDVTTLLKKVGQPASNR
jgi:hypothetical protein